MSGSTCSASSEASAANGCDKATDKSLTGWWSNEDVGAWIKIDFPGGAAYLLFRVTITNKDSEYRRQEASTDRDGTSENRREATLLL